MIAEADACKHGELGVMLRREQLYRNQLSSWRRENGERRAQRPAQHNAIPRPLVFSPNEVWSWDITKLPLVRRGIYAIAVCRAGPVQSFCRGLDALEKRE